MKKVILLFTVICLTLSFLQAQNPDEVTTSSLNKLAQRLSFSASMSTPSWNGATQGKLSLRDFSNVNLGELNISYKLNNRLSFGLSNMSNLSNPTSGYYTAENTFVPFCLDDDDDAEMDDDLEMDDDENDDNDCDDDEFGQNLMGTATFGLSEKIPFFIQVAGGYSFAANAPAYSTVVGYNQKIVGGLGIQAGIRFSDILYKKPVEAVSLSPSHSIRFELGVNWNL